MARAEARARADATASTSPLLLIGVLAAVAPRASMLGKTIPFSGALRVLGLGLCCLPLAWRFLGPLGWQVWMTPAVA